MPPPSPQFCRRLCHVLFDWLSRLKSRPGTIFGDFDVGNLVGVSSIVANGICTIEMISAAHMGNPCEEMAEPNVPSITQTTLLWK